MHIPLQVKLSQSTGFTLIEISIVLVIIGLLVGGILTGRDLIDAAAQRAQVTQIERYNTAVNTFRNKYGGLPGDLQDPYATRFGFQPRGQWQGEGDGNGVIEGNCGNTIGWNDGFQEGCGELPAFWQDLSTANLAAGPSPYTGQTYPSMTTSAGGTYLPTLYQWFPNPKLGQDSNFLYVFSMGGTNYFAISSVNHVSWYPVGNTNPGITVQQAYNIDSKIDDGLPQSGRVMPCYNNYSVANATAVWAAGNGLQGTNGGANCTPTNAATLYATTNCYDNGNTAGTTQKYSITQNANVQNCALSFKFQ